MRFRVRYTFEKTGVARFIGHLDLQALFQRALKRAALPVAFSKGFNPHSLVSFAMPLSVGMAGLREIVEVEMTRDCDAMALAAAMPEGIRVTGARFMAEGEKPAAARVCAADYRIVLPGIGNPQILTDSIQDLCSQDVIIVEKRTKKGMSEADIRKDILSLTCDVIAITTRLAAGSERNLKPDIVARLLCEAMGVDFQPYNTQYTRTALYAEGGEPL